MRMRDGFWLQDHWQISNTIFKSNMAQTLVIFEDTTEYITYTTNEKKGFTEWRWLICDAISNFDRYLHSDTSIAQRVRTFLNFITPITLLMLCFNCIALYTKTTYEIGQASVQSTYVCVIVKVNMNMCVRVYACLWFAAVKNNDQITAHRLNIMYITFGHYTHWYR